MIARTATILGLIVAMYCTPQIIQAGEIKEIIDGVEWTTHDGLPYAGSPKAVPGGRLRIAIPQYLPTLRREGPSSQLATITDIYGLTHQPLVSLHHETNEYVPVLASHWRVSADKRVYTFKIDRRARFSTGKEVTAKDVVASFKHLINPDIKDPSTKLLFDNYYEMPKAIDKYTVEVKTKLLSWRAMLYFGASMVIYPAEEISIPGDIYLKEYNWKMMPGTGPYIIKDVKKDLVDGASIKLTRRENCWDDKLPRNVGLYNFKYLSFLVIRERTIAFEKIKKGELDYLQILKSQRWVEECDFNNVKQGYVLKQKVYNEQPQGFSGYMLNMREWPFDDINVRLAFASAFNREKLFKKMFFNEYEYLSSYYPASIWGAKNSRVKFNPERAERFLEKAGYTKRNKDGIRVHEKTGKTLSFVLEFGTPSFERIHRVVQEDLRRVGFDMELKQVDYNALSKKVNERKFKAHFISWRAIAFPNPLTSWSSKLANQLNNNNLSGFGNADVDKLIKKYDLTFDRSEQIAHMQKLDKIVFKSHCTALGWFAPFTRLLSWNRYGMPKKVLTRYTDPRAIWSTWYLDPVKDAKLKAAIKAGTSLPLVPVIVDGWGVKAKLSGGSKRKD